jgi:hypothetical protein
MKNNLLTSLTIAFIFFTSCSPSTEEKTKLASKTGINDLLKSDWSVDTLTAKVVHTCYYYYSHFPYIIKSPLSDTNRKKVNEKIREISFKVPAIMSNVDYKSFRSCEEGDYNHLVAKHSQHVLNNECSWCQSEFSSSLEHIEQGKYLSVLMLVSYSAGGNWVHLGHNSFNLNLKNNEVITIPSNSSVKNKLIEEIKVHLIKTPMIDSQGLKYPILNQIQKWNVDDLSFYFKNDSLRLIFTNEENGLFNQTLDIPLPKLQQYLNF